MLSSTPFKKMESSSASTQSSKPPTTEQSSTPTPPVTSTSLMCTKVCGSASRTETCAKTLLVEAYLEANPKLSKPVYVVIDDQSNSSFVDERLAKFFNVKFPVRSYKILSAQRDCSIRTKGLQVTGLRLN